MAINYEQMMQSKTEGLEASYGDREVMLYALGVGFQRDPMNERELPFTYEKDLVVVPTFATVIPTGRPRAGAAAGSNPMSGINYLMVVHGEQRVTIHKPLPPAAEVVSDTRVLGVWDKGKDKGAIIVNERVIKEKSTGDKLATLVGTTFARGDGGFGGPKDGAPEPHQLPTRKPDLVHECDTRADQAFIYALSGDRNPLHRDPAVAKRAGFPKPILHGLCSFGTACRAVISTICDYDPKKITSFDVRFSSPVFPGETIVTEMWVDGEVVSYRSRLKERDVVVLNNGRCTIAK
ncbi:MAG: MaoC family dehydratase N-terminal domain-containing protein [Proteobacteria bacterium]|nr:MaoC family dehydratase N-terminal domain-containing protein [Pseudomonadota bacterium]